MKNDADACIAKQNIVHLSTVCPTIPTWGKYGGGVGDMTGNMCPEGWGKCHMILASLASLIRMPMLASLRGGATAIAS